MSEIGLAQHRTNLFLYFLAMVLFDKIHSEGVKTKHPNNRFFRVREHSVWILRHLGPHRTEVCWDRKFNKKVDEAMSAASSNRNETKMIIKKTLI